MTRRWLFVVVALNLVVLVALAFIYPHLMVSPGPLVKGHVELTTDCFACHAPLRGASSERCVSCHVVPDIGLRSTLGVTLVSATHKPAFHQNLAEQDCMACHSDHLGPQTTLLSRKKFSHALLQSAMRERCDSCHKAPTDSLHSSITNFGNCVECHRDPGVEPDKQGRAGESGQHRKKKDD